jgi:hypothetical protein
MTHTLPCLALALLLLPAAALAQPETGGRIENLREETRGDAPIPEVAWEERFQGLHAVDGACDEADAVWAFALNTVEMGRTICTSLGKIIWEDGWLLVPRRAMQPHGRGGRQPLDRPARGRRRDRGALRRLGSVEIRLERCPHPED